MIQTDKLHPLVIAEEDILILSGKVIAENITYEDYLTGKYGRHTEWVYGVVIAMSPVSIPHDRLGFFLRMLFSTYLKLTTGGNVFGDPVVMKSTPDLPGRQPDIQVVLPDRAHFIEHNQVAGPANLVVEIVSPESVDRDRGTKFEEYEKGGVDEYWILDQPRQDALFYVRGEDGLFHSSSPIDGVYTSTVLPKLKIAISLLWEDQYPGAPEVVEMVKQMLSDDKE
jgi:Uma2 family endonuclease